MAYLRCEVSIFVCVFTILRKLRLSVHQLPQSGPGSKTLHQFRVE